MSGPSRDLKLRLPVFSAPDPALPRTRLGQEIECLLMEGQDRSVAERVKVLRESQNTAYIEQSI